MTPQEFMQKQALPYEAKVVHAALRAREFYEKLEGNVFCSVGGLDSITLLTFLRREVDKGIPGVSVSSIEDKSNQAVHCSFDNFVMLTPMKSKVMVLQECGFPVISKDKASKIQLLQNPSEKNATVRHAIITGETGKLGGYRTVETGSMMRLPQKWLDLFGGPENQKYGTNYQTAPFRVSPDCCYWMKEKPCNNYAKQTGRSPYMALMASEGGQREKALFKHGCNYYGKTVTRSCPFAIFSRQDILQLALDLNIQVPTVYGTIERKQNGELYTTRAQRTGCTMCGFGIHIEPRPHRFDRLREDNPKEWEFWMYRCVTDPITGEKYGWGRVLDYIGVEWETPPDEQISMDFRMMEAI